MQGRWESSTGSTQVVIADNLGFSPAPYTVLIDGRTILSDTTTGNGLAVYSYTVPLRDDLAHNLSTRLDSGVTATSRGIIQPCPLQFTDVPSTSAFYNYVRWLACSGYISGYPCGGPGEPCPRPLFPPRQQRHPRAVDEDGVNAAGWPFADPALAHLRRRARHAHLLPYVETGGQPRLISGYPCGGPGEPCDAPGNRPYFRPGNEITRGQLSKVIALAPRLHLGPRPPPPSRMCPSAHLLPLYRSPGPQQHHQRLPLRRRRRTLHPARQPPLFPPRQLCHPRPGRQVRHRRLRRTISPSSQPQSGNRV